MDSFADTARECGFNAGDFNENFARNVGRQYGKYIPHHFSDDEDEIGGYMHLLRGFSC